MLSTLPKWNRELFTNVVLVRAGIEYESDQQTLNGWWYEQDKYFAWLNRLEKAYENCPLKPETSEGRRLYRNALNAFNEINLLYNKLLGQKSHWALELWYWPIFTQFKDRPESEIVSRLVELIDSFLDQYWTNTIDRTIAVLEAVAIPQARAQDPSVIRQKIAQWSAEEMIALYNRAKANYLAGYDLPSTVDELDIELRELSDAVNGPLWDRQERKHIRKQLRQVRKGMSAFCVDTQAIIDLNDLYRYCGGEIGQSVSITTILTNTESTFEALISDRTQKEFWDQEYEDNDEE